MFKKQILRIFNGRLFTVRRRLIISFALILIIPSLLISGFSFVKARSEMNKQFISTSEENVKIVDEIINNTLEPRILQAIIYSKSLIYDEKDNSAYSKFKQEFDDFMELNLDLESIFFGTSDGTMIQSPQNILGSGYDPRDEDWYEEATKNRGKVIISKPYLSIATGSLVVAISKEAEDRSGVFGMEVSLENIKNVISNVSIGEKGYIMILNPDKYYIAHPTKEVGSIEKDTNIGKMFEKNDGMMDLVDNGNQYMVEYTTNMSSGWKISGFINKSEINDMTMPILFQTLIVILVSILVGGFIVYFIIISITNPLNKLKKSAIQVSEGDLTQEVEIIREDEIGQVAQAFKNMAKNLHRIITEVNIKSEHVAASSEQLLASSEQTTTSSEYVASTLQEVASRAELQSDRLINNSDSLQNISNHVNKVAENVKEVSILANATVLQAKEGEESVEHTVSQMNGIYESVEILNRQISYLQDRTKSIESIVDAISGIAGQTNLLALNAAIEAARAGEQGKGFAVVAGEVGKLAKQSEESAREIGEIVNNILADTKTTVKGMEAVTRNVQNGITASQKTSDTFIGIIERVESISPQIEEVSNIANTIAENVETVAVSANDLLAISKENAAFSENMATTTDEQLAAMQEIKASASSLADLAEGLKKNINKFKI